MLPERRRLELNFANPTVKNLHLAALGDEDVRRLDIAVDDAARMRRFQRIRDLNSIIQDHIERQRLVVDPVLQRLAIEEFHGDERLAAVRSDVVNRADVRVIERGCGLRLALESFERRGIVRRFVRQKLQRDRTAKPRVFGLEYDAHPATAEFFEDAIVRDRLSNNGLRVRHGPPS